MAKKFYKVIDDFDGLTYYYKDPRGAVCPRSAPDWARDMVDSAPYGGRVCCGFEGKRAIVTVTIFDNPCKQ